jgi:CheY-like chemotaxis protein
MASDRRKGAIVVLVVDDDPAVLRVTAELFRHLGYDVLSAETGYDALDILRSGDPIDVLFADLCMPGMDGDRLVEAARALRPALHVIVTSGSALPRQHVQFIPKPYHIADLVAALSPERALAEPAG